MRLFTVFISIFSILFFYTASFAESKIDTKKADFIKNLEIAGINLTMQDNEIKNIAINNGYTLTSKKINRNKSINYSFENKSKTNVLERKTLHYRVDQLGVVYHINYAFKYRPPTEPLHRWDNTPMGEEAKYIVEGLCDKIQTPENYNGTVVPCRVETPSASRIKINTSVLGKDNKKYLSEISVDSSGIYTVDLKRQETK